MIFSVVADGITVGGIAVSGVDPTTGICVCVQAVRKNNRIGMSFFIMTIMSLRVAVIVRPKQSPVRREIPIDWHYLLKWRLLRRPFRAPRNDMNLRCRADEVKSVQR